MSLSLSVCLSPAAEQYDGVLVRGCAVSRRVEAAVHQTPTPVQVSQIWVNGVYKNRLTLCWIMLSRIFVIVEV
jgi:hypothetical protein